MTLADAEKNEDYLIKGLFVEETMCTDRRYPIQHLHLEATCHILSEFPWEHALRWMFRQTMQRITGFLTLLSAMILP